KESRSVIFRTAACWPAMPAGRLYCSSGAAKIFLPSAPYAPIMAGRARRGGGVGGGVLPPVPPPLFGAPPPRGGARAQPGVLLPRRTAERVRVCSRKAGKGGGACTDLAHFASIRRHSGGRRG